MADPLTLIIGEDRIEVSRADLTSTSAYFACLLSENFKDHLLSEHRIQYDIDTATLQTFVNWTSEHVASVIGDRRHVKPSLSHFVGDVADFDRLLLLLQLAVLFAADTLLQDLSDLIACHWLIPEKSIQIWLLARELGLPVLRDLAKAACVERLRDLPESQLLELPGEDFIELVGNIRAEIAVSFPSKLVERWVKRNVSPGQSNAFDSQYPFTLIQWRSWSGAGVQEMYRDQNWNHNIQCIVVHKHIDDNKARKCVYGWDGTNLAEILDLTSCPIWENDIVGLQVVGRGFDIYLVGGKYAGSRVFQREIWRYSMITKTWFYVTRIPHPRRHMAAAFAGSKLVLVGGTGKGRVRLRSADVYDIDTGKWKKAQDSRVYFTNKSLICPGNRDITLYNLDGRRLHSYSPDEDQWFVGPQDGDWTESDHESEDEGAAKKQKRDDHKNDDEVETDNDNEADHEGDSNDEDELAPESGDDMLQYEFRGLSYYVEGGHDYHYYQHDQYYFYPKSLMFGDGHYVLCRYTKGCQYENSEKKVQLYTQQGSRGDGEVLQIIQVHEFVSLGSDFVGNCTLESFDNQVCNGRSLVGFARSKEGTISIELVNFDDGESKIVYKENRADIIDLCPEDPVGSFNLYDPKSLNEVFVLEKETTHKEAKDRDKYRHALWKNGLFFIISNEDSPE